MSTSNKKPSTSTGNTGTPARAKQVKGLCGTCHSYRVLEWSGRCKDCHPHYCRLRNLKQRNTAEAAIYGEVAELRGLASAWDRAVRRR